MKPQKSKKSRKKKKPKFIGEKGRNINNGRETKI